VVELWCAVVKDLRYQDRSRAMAPPVVGRPFLQVALSEAKRNWPFVVGFATTLSVVTKLSLSLDPKDAQKSPFINPHAHY
jgi:hypothetical protein